MLSSNKVVTYPMQLKYFLGILKPWTSLKFLWNSLTFQLIELVND